MVAVAAVLKILVVQKVLEDMVEVVKVELIMKHVNQQLELLILVAAAVVVAVVVLFVLVAKE